MPEVRPSPLNLRALRERAHLSRGALAEGLGLSYPTLRSLESGAANPRLATVLRLTQALAGPLGQPPSRVFEDLIPETAYAPYGPLREAAADRLAAIQTHYGSAARRRFANAPAEPPDQPEPAEHSLGRLQGLYARSRFSQTDLIDLTGLSYRTVQIFFGVQAPTARNTTLAVFLLLTAALAPVHGGSVKDAVLHVLDDDLRRLDARYAANTRPA